MNILEALEVVERNGFIRYEDKIGFVWFIMQTTLIPVGAKSIIKVELDCAEKLKKFPNDLMEMDYEEIDDVCLSAIRNHDFTEISYEEMMDEIKQKFSGNL